MLTRDIFKANDIRGVAVATDSQPVQWDAAGARTIGAHWARVLDLGPGATIVMGRDMRLTSPEFSAAFAQGIAACGVNVIDIGLASTDLLWFASGHLDLPGVMFTASHNPGHWNGIKFCMAQARPVQPEHLTRLAELALAADSAASPDAASPDAAGAAGVSAGTIEQRDLLGAYADHLHSLVDLAGLRELTVVADAGNGMAGHTLPAVFENTPIKIIGLFTDPDGSFPNHQPNPLEPENLVDAQRAVVEHGADLALVFDGDADRCFIIDERGEVVNPSTLTAVIAVQELAREPGATIVRNTITSRAVDEIVAENGGTVVVTKVGHTYVKAAMATHNAIFGGEHSAHYYFRDFWSADTGMLAALHTIALAGRQDKPLSEVVNDFARYAASGEINFTVQQTQECQAAVAQAFAEDGTISYEDGLLITGDRWWVNVRPSNTEPLLRLNVEAPTPDEVAALTERVRAIVATWSDSSTTEGS